MKKTHYEILAVAEDATSEQIKTAFRQAAKRCHPDLNRGSAASAEEFKSINAAYAVLCDLEQRSAYDRALGAERAQSKLGAQPAKSVDRPPSGSAENAAAPSARGPAWPPVAPFVHPSPSHASSRVAAPSGGAILGTVLAGLGLSLLFGVLGNGGATTWDASVGRHRSSDGRFSPK